MWTGIMGRELEALDPLPPPLIDPLRFVQVPNAILRKLSYRATPGLPLSRREKAARQQGGLFFRENSSNGGKAIRTFWRNTKFGKNRCQGQNSLPVSRYLG